MALVEKTVLIEHTPAEMYALVDDVDAAIPGVAVADTIKQVDLAGRVVLRDGAEVELSPREFSLLETLVRHRGQVLSRDQLLERVWGYDADPAGNVVDLYIHYLRRKLDTAGSKESLIRTVRGAGYTLRGA